MQTGTRGNGGLQLASKIMATKGMINGALDLGKRLWRTRRILSSKIQRAAINP